MAVKRKSINVAFEQAQRRMALKKVKKKVPKQQRVKVFLRVGTKPRKDEIKVAFAKKSQKTSKRSNKRTTRRR